MRQAKIKLFLRLFVLTNILGFIYIWSYNQKQEATILRYKDMLTNDLTNLQTQLSDLQKESQKNNAAIGQMKNAVQGFIEKDKVSHQRILDILNEAQRELVTKRPPSFGAKYVSQHLEKGEQGRQEPKKKQ